MLIHARLAASVVKATRMDRPEWIVVSPTDGQVYCTLTNNAKRGEEGQPVGGPNPREKNVYGQILRWKADADNHGSNTFSWDLFVVAGNPGVHAGTPKGGSSNINPQNMFNSPDGLGFDKAGQLRDMIKNHLLQLLCLIAMDPPADLSADSAGGQHHGLVSAFMERAFGGSVGQGLDDPAPTITAGGGGKSSLVSLTLSPEHEAGALRVAAFLISYYGTENVSACDAPTPTITTKDRLALVTVMVKGTPYVIVDICLRMLKPAELYKAQGFPTSYVITHGADGKPFNITQQVHMCGNSVSPPPMAALARANDPWRAEERQARAA